MGNKFLFTIMILENSKNSKSFCFHSHFPNQRPTEAPHCLEENVSNFYHQTYPNDFHFADKLP